MDRAGISREVAKKISGHKTDSAYRQYNIVDNRDIKGRGEDASGVFEGAEMILGPDDKPNVTFITAICGVVFGFRGLLLSRLNFLRDRPKLVVTLGWDMPPMVQPDL